MGFHVPVFVDGELVKVPVRRGVYFSLDQGIVTIDYFPRKQRGKERTAVISVLCGVVRYRPDDIDNDIPWHPKGGWCGGEVFHAQLSEVAIWIARNMKLTGESIRAEREAKEARRRRRAYLKERREATGRLNAIRKR